MYSVPTAGFIQPRGGETCVLGGSGGAAEMSVFGMPVRGTVYLIAEDVVKHASQYQGRDMPLVC